MKVAVVTSVSSAIASYASLTVPNKAEYCLRHGYSLVVDNAPYEEAMPGVAWLISLFERYDLLWVLDADTVITNMTIPIHTLDCLGPHFTACEEGIVPWNRINCGSIVWRDTFEACEVLREITQSPEKWRGLPCGWQTWLADRPVLTVAPLRAFNSCAWNRPGGAAGDSGSHWRPGDFVFHPCGVYPLESRTESIKAAIAMVQR